MHRPLLATLALLLPPIFMANPEIAVMLQKLDAVQR